MAEAVIPNVTIRTETRVSRIEGFPESVGTSMDHAAPVRLQHINRLIKELNANKRLAQVMPKVRRRWLYPNRMLPSILQACSRCLNWKNIGQDQPGGRCNRDLFLWARDHDLELIIVEDPSSTAHVVHKINERLISHQYPGKPVSRFQAKDEQAMKSRRSIE
jgi:hypothetical protein